MRCVSSGYQSQPMECGGYVQSPSSCERNVELFARICRSYMWNSFPAYCIEEFERQDRGNQALQDKFEGFAVDYVAGKYDEVLRDPKNLGRLGKKPNSSPIAPSQDMKHKSTGPCGKGSFLSPTSPATATSTTTARLSALLDVRMRSPTREDLAAPAAPVAPKSSVADNDVSHTPKPSEKRTGNAHPSNTGVGHVDVECVLSRKRNAEISSNNNLPISKRSRLTSASLSADLMSQKR